MSFRWVTDPPGSTTGYHFMQLLVGGNVVWEHDLAPRNAGQQVSINLDSAISGETSLPITFRVFDKRGVSNYGAAAFIYEMQATGLDLGAGGFGAWTASRQNAATWTAESITRGHRGRCILMVGATKGSDDVPYITDALTLGQEAIAECRADGVMMYCLDKNAGSSTFAPVASLYQTWANVPDGGACDSADAGEAGDGDAGVGSDEGAVESRAAADSGAVQVTGANCGSCAATAPGPNWAGFVAIALALAQRAKRLRNGTARSSLVRS